jgi:hypothetical protein
MTMTSSLALTKNYGKRRATWGNSLSILLFKIIIEENTK